MHDLLLRVEEYVAHHKETQRIAVYLQAIGTEYLHRGDIRVMLLGHYSGKTPSHLADVAVRVRTEVLAIHRGIGLNRV